MDCANHLMKGDASHVPHRVQASQGVLIHLQGLGVEVRRLQHGDVGGDCDTLEVGLLHRLVCLLEEQGNSSALTDRVANTEVAHHAAEGLLGTDR